METPYDDEELIYDKGARMYVPTPSGVQNLLGITLELELNDEDGKTAERFLKRCSRTVYGYFYQNSINRGWQEYQLAKNEGLREELKQTLYAQVEYNLRNGFIQDFGGVNLAKNVKTDTADIRGAAKVCDEVITFGMRIIPEAGVCLMYTGIMPLLKYKYREGY